MYLTILSNQAPKQITWEDILKDPYITFDVKSGKKKVTAIISKEYGEQLWNRRKWKEDPLQRYHEIISHIKTEEHYRHFEIPKKSNPHKKRKIDAPDEELSTLQTYFKEVIEKQLQVQVHKAAHAYVAERSTITAMQIHQANNSNWYLQIDLKDFFNSINGNWLRRMLKEVYPFRFIDSNSLEDLIKISLLRGTLPQGSHLSPTLTNIAMVPIDHDICEKLHNYKRHHYVYTRYADDITISCKEKFDPNEIIGVIKSVFNYWEVPFKINNEKTRFGSKAGRNYHLGIIVNKDNQLSVGHEKNQKFRAQIYNFCLVGEEWERHDIQKMLGLISYYRAIEPDFVTKVLKKYGEKFNIDVEKKAYSLLAV